MNKELTLVKKDNDGKIIEKQVVRNGYGAYVWTNWIPFAGFFVFLIMSIMRKEFKAVFLNRCLLQFVLGLCIGVTMFWTSDIALGIAVYTGALIIDIFLAKSINYTKASQLILAGYTCENPTSTDTDFLNKASSIKTPWYQWIKFK